MRRILANLLLLVASVFASLVLCEVTLRVGYPKYQQAAEPEYDRDSIAIWSARPNRRFTVLHPDTLVGHEVVYNSLALRQSREFVDVDSAVNIAFFGDSFTANLGLPSQYSFTEPLDYLLNLGGEHPVNVLNFGVSGYGTDQSYLNYLAFDNKAKLEHVFYVLCANDLRNIYETHLFSLDSAGNLKRTPVPKPSPWTSLVSRLHVTYLLLDVKERLLHSRSGDPEGYRESMEQAALQALHDERFDTPQARSVQQDFVRAEVTDDVARTLAIFNALLVQWRQAVEETGAEFHIVLLPTGQEDRFRDVIPRDFSVLSLQELMSAADADFRWEDLTFHQDGHWAELGNMLAASVLCPFTAQALGHSVLPPDAIAEALRAYYSAFPGGWLPPGVEPLPGEQDNLAPIRNKYLALELSASH